MSAPLQNSPSVQDAVLLACVQVSLISLQVSVVQTLPSLQLFGVPPPQAPALQVSLTVQNSPSLHGAVFGVCRQVPELSQVSSVQGLLSSVQAVPAGATHESSPSSQLLLQLDPTLLAINLGSPHLCAAAALATARPR